MHCKIYYKVIHKYFNDDKFLEKKEELIKDCKYHIYFAAKEFAPEKNTKFSSYLANKARWMCLNFFTAERKKKRMEDYPTSLSPLLESPSLLNEILTKERFKKILDEISKDKDERVGEIFTHRYFSSKNNKLTSWKEVSNKLSLSVQGCINIHNRFLRKLQSRIEK
jgi:RNA polymerase sigma factor (sigma-70 family)